MTVGLMCSILFLLAFCIVMVIYADSAPKLEMKGADLNKTLISKEEVAQHLKIPFKNNGILSDFKVDYSLFEPLAQQGIEEFAVLSSELKPWTNDKITKGISFLLSNIDLYEFYVEIYSPRSSRTAGELLLNDVTRFVPLYSKLVKLYKSENNGDIYTLTKLSFQQNRKYYFDQKRLFIIRIESRNSVYIPKEKEIVIEHRDKIIELLLNIINGKHIASTAAQKKLYETIRNKANNFVQEKDIDCEQSKSLLKINFQPKEILSEDYYSQKLQKLVDLKEKKASDYFDIAEMYFYGRRGGSVDKCKSRENYQNAYNSAVSELIDKLENYEAKYIIGICAERLLLSNVKFFDYLKAAADGGYPPAEAELAFRYMKGCGVDTDFNKAYFYALKASSHGNMFGRAILGAYFLTIKNDTKKGVRLILESAEAGDPGGQYMLFRCLYYSKGIVKDKELAMKVFKLSADQGFMDSVSKWRNLNRNK